MRDRVGLEPGEVEVTEVGEAIRIAAVEPDDRLVHENGRLVIPANGVEIDDEWVARTRRSLQR